MEEKTFLTVDEVAELLSVSKSKAYEIVRQLNKESGETKDVGYYSSEKRWNRSR